MTVATLLLPRRRYLGGSLGRNVATMLSRAHRMHARPGELAQLRRYFTYPAAHWPIAAMTRTVDNAQDTAVEHTQQALWLRADPAWVQPDITGARLLGYGPSLQLEQQDAEAFTPTLHSLFAEHGLVFDAPVPTRWYIRLPTQSTVPHFSPPEDALGDDVLDYMPDGAEAAHWGMLLAQAQMLLHQHPRNIHRRAEGKPCINSLWFWGEGRMQAAMHTQYQYIQSQDVLLQAIAQMCGLLHTTNQDKSDAPTIIDLRHMRSLQELVDQVFLPVIDALRTGQLRQCIADFQDGLVIAMRPSSRWHFWKTTQWQLDAL